MSSVDWAVYCKPLCTESQRRGIQRLLSEATEKEGFTMVEQDRVRTIVLMNKGRKYDAAKNLLQKTLTRFPGTGATGLWTLHSVSADAHGDAQSSSTTVPPIELASFQQAPALALKCALLYKGARPSQSHYTVSKDSIGKGVYATVWAAVGPEQAAVAIKSFTDKHEALVEVTAYTSLPPHPNVLKLLDVAVLPNDMLGLVFPRYQQNLRDFALERQAGFQSGELERPYELEELRHCALCLGCGLGHVHAHGLTHTDLKPANVLVTGGGLAKVAAKDLTESLRNLPLRVVIADFGLAQLADPQHRELPSEWDMKEQSMQLCTLYYRAPELLLGDRLFGRPVDLWSLGCVLGELCCGRPLFAAADEIGILLKTFQLLGTPRAGHLAGLPHYKTDFPNFPRAAWPPAGVPAELSATIQQCLELDPGSRISARGVCTNLREFARMKVIVNNRDGGQGSATILEQCVEHRLLTYLQEDPGLQEMIRKFTGESSDSRQCLKNAEKKLGLKYEEGGHVTTASPDCTQMATLDMSRPTSCKRVGMFGRAYIKRNHPQFLRIGQEIADRIRQFPQHLREGQNAKDFLGDVLADTCLAYAVIQVMQPTVRSDPSHYDGGASLVHSGLTLYGRRDLALLYPDGKIEVRAQTPGQYYTGNLCAIRHEVRHRKPVGQELLNGHEIAIMFRTDCFRGNRARKLVGKLTPIHIYDAVNEVVARALAREPFYLPTYAEVMAEEPTVGLPAPGGSQSAEVSIVELPAPGGSPAQPPPKRQRS